MASKLQPLPSPFQDVRVEVEISDSCVHLLYVGTADRLIESGCAEPAMVEVSQKNCRPRVDSHGHYYHREPRWNRGTRIDRYITDPPLAIQLPGAPQKMSFQRLDWLDSNSGECSIQTEEVEHGGKINVSRRTAGSAAALAAHGYPRHLFDPSWRPGNFCRDGNLRPDLGWHQENHVYVWRLMRGYFEVIESRWHSIGAAVPERPQAAQRKRPAHLRLAWTNPAAAMEVRNG